MWKDSIRNIAVIFQTTILRFVGFYVRHSAKVCCLVAFKLPQHKCYPSLGLLPNTNAVLIVAQHTQMYQLHVVLCIFNLMNYRELFLQSMGVNLAQLEMDPFYSSFPFFFAWLSRLLLLPLLTQEQPKMQWLQQGNFGYEVLQLT